MTSLGLLITAVVQTVRKQLDLYHAIFVLHIIYSLGIVFYLSGALPPIPTFSFADPRPVTRSGAFRKTISQFRPASRATIQMVTIGLFLGWSAYVWAHAKTFGSSPECNARVTYVFFFHSVGATVTWLRLLWIYGLAVTVGITLLGIIVVGLQALACAEYLNVNEDDLDIEGHSLYVSSTISASLMMYVPLSLLPDGR
jgi:hypothetical protein